MIIVNIRICSIFGYIYIVIINIFEWFKIRNSKIPFFWWLVVTNNDSIFNDDDVACHVNRVLQLIVNIMTYNINFNKIAFSDW